MVWWGDRGAFADQVGSGRGEKVTGYAATDSDKVKKWFGSIWQAVRETVIGLWR
jgi:hypothetical protein